MCLQGALVLLSAMQKTVESSSTFSAMQCDVLHQGAVLAGHMGLYPKAMPL